jgi:catalase
MRMVLENFRGSPEVAREEPRGFAVKRATVSHFYQADKDYGTRLAKAVGVDIKELQAMTSH